MKRALLARMVAECVSEHVVLASLGTAGRAWREFGGENPTFFVSDPMGAAPGVALGAALARPDLEFVLLEGDGDLVMNLGVLLSIAGAAPTNLRVIVFNNARYETGGGQPLAASERADLAMIATGAGWSRVSTLAADATESEIRDCLTELMSREGPALVVAAVDTEPSPYGGSGDLSGVEARASFQDDLKSWLETKEDFR